ncbi:hypothetical protein [Dactylosporangium darangshiense]|uniref:hypothetical protein n=1 Tax=Dactylosporangium darangshiense TaxID=579108 RepID=UPI003640DBA4
MEQVAQRVRARCARLGDDPHRVDLAGLFGGLYPLVEQHADARVQPVLSRTPRPDQDHVHPSERHAAKNLLFGRAVEDRHHQRSPRERMHRVCPLQKLIAAHAGQRQVRDEHRDLLAALPQRGKRGQPALGDGLRLDLVVGAEPPLERLPQRAELLGVLADQEQHRRSLPTHRVRRPSAERWKRVYPRRRPATLHRLSRAAGMLAWKGAPRPIPPNRSDRSVSP